MSAKGSRCGWSSPRRRPALELACTPVSRRFGCPASSRHTSPPAYPVAPVTPTVHVCPVLTMHDHTRVMHDCSRGIARGAATDVRSRWSVRGGCAAADDRPMRARSAPPEPSTARLRGRWPPFCARPARSAPIGRMPDGCDDFARSHCARADCVELPARAGDGQHGDAPGTRPSSVTAAPSCRCDGRSCREPTPRHRADGAARRRARRSGDRVVVPVGLQAQLPGGVRPACVARRTSRSSPPARRKRPDHWSSSPAAIAATSSTTSSGGVQSVRPSPHRHRRASSRSRRRRARRRRPARRCPPARRPAPRSAASARSWPPSRRSTPAAPRSAHAAGEVDHPAAVAQHHPRHDGAAEQEARRGRGWRRRPTTGRGRPPRAAPRTRRSARRC